MALIANARMYAVTPQVRAAWQALFAWVAKASGVRLVYLDHAAPAPLEALWERSDLGVAFMCGYPFARAAHRPSLIAAPIPSPPRYAAMPRYCTDFVVRADRPFTHLSETSGGRMGWTVEHSQSGYNAVRYHLLRCRETAPALSFAQWIGPLITPRRVIEALAEGAIDVGPLDSYVHDLLKRHHPETVSSLRTVGQTVMTPIPPLVASPAVAGETVEHLRRVLLSCAAEPQMAEILDTLMITGFAKLDPDAYDVLLLQARAADAGAVVAPGQSGSAD